MNDIGVQEAWKQTRGNSDIIVAVIDTGVDYTHEDLAPNLWRNINEIAENGIDDDNNGYVDDIRGWDFGGLSGTADNNPKEDRADHGTLVAGLASAVTNNGIGIASIGYKSKLMAVKASQDDIRSESGTALVAYGYDGIIYAADNGAKIINCSWGSNSYSLAAQAVIDYAVSKGALIVAAAGNDNASQGFYPAGFDGVLSVAATDNSDTRAWFSNYGNKIDVCAPGVNVYSTWQDSPFYHTTSGTSLSSPIAAGLAALVVNQFPNFTPLQIGEQIRVNSDNIDNVNLNFIKQLGYGRINAYKALTNANSKSVRISDIAFIEIGDDDGIFESGESVKIVPTFTNYLDPLVNLTAILSSDNPNVEIVNSGGNIGAISTLQTKSVSPDFYLINIPNNAEDNVDINLLLTLEDGTYQDFEWITLNINPTYEIQSTENLSITFTSTGSIGFDDYPTNLKGNGLRYKNGPNVMFEGALLYGTSENTIVSSARNVDGDKDNDFLLITPIKTILSGGIADKQTIAKFNDANASPKSLGIETEFSSYSYSDIEDADYMFVRYSLTNTTDNVIDSFHIGQYWDFDIDENSYDDDMAAYDVVNNFGYVFDSGNSANPISTYVGLALLSEGTTSYFAMNDKGEGNPTISWDGFSDFEKWTALTSEMNHTLTGPNDISVVISGGPYSLIPNVKQDFDFLIAAGDDLENLTQSVIRAKQKYAEALTDIKFVDEAISENFELKQNYPNPFNPTTIINYTIPASPISGLITLKIYDVLGKEVVSLVNQQQQPGNYEISFNANNLSSGVYYYQLKAGNFIQTKKLILLK
ncbi:MAG: S8 family serine peptidase, partial [Ignavibacteriae bacterium]|nr:S8 family serine peptidase [Ignavibacteriota bacterium]